MWFLINGVFKLVFDRNSGLRIAVLFFEAISRFPLQSFCFWQQKQKGFSLQSGLKKKKMKLIRTTSDNPDFEKLVVALDAYLRILDGEDHAFYAQFNKSDSLKYALICYENDMAVGIGAYKEYDSQTAEIKRMYTLPEHRGKGIAKAILNELEVWAAQENYTQSILETGFMQLDAIGLYQKLGYTITENFGQYIGVANSVCMRKII